MTMLTIWFAMSMARAALPVPTKPDGQLYIGPLDNTPSGRAVTLVDLKTLILTAIRI